MHITRPKLYDFNHLRFLINMKNLEKVVWYFPIFSSFFVVLYVFNNDLIRNFLSIKHIQYHLSVIWIVVHYRSLKWTRQLFGTCRNNLKISSFFTISRGSVSIAWWFFLEILSNKAYSRSYTCYLVSERSLEA